MPNLCLLLPIAIPLLGAILSAVIPFRRDRARNAFLLAVTLLTTASAWALILMPPKDTLMILHFVDGLDFALRLDGAGRIFAGLSSALWPLALIYAFDYMKHFSRLLTFYTFFTLSFAATMGIAMSENMLTMYLFYELLTLTTLPLIMAERNKVSSAAARKYMMYSFGGAAFVFVAITFLIHCGANDFTYGGSFTLSMGDETLAVIMFLFAFFGFGVKAAIFPFHGWLPAASVAPTPVTALLHAVAVVKAGVFAVIRLIYYAFGTEFLKETRVQYVVMAFALFTLLFASAMALRQTHFKRRLAYSTVSNLSYILFAASTLTEAGLVAAFLHMVFHSCMKMPAFLTAGAALHYGKKEMLADIEGLGRKMPLSFLAYAICGLSLAGIPPFSGFFSKWSIATAAIETGDVFAVVGVGILLIAALLAAIYATSVTVRAFFPRKEALDRLGGVREASPLMTVPMLLLAVVTLLFGIFGGTVAELFTSLLVG